MRLLIATPLYPPEPGGPATFAHILNAELPKRGVEVSVVKFSDVKHFPKVIRHIAYGIKVFNAAHNADMILALDPVSTGFPALFAARFAQKRFLVRIVGDRAWETGFQSGRVFEPMDIFARRRFSSGKLTILKLVQKIVASFAEKIIVPSEYLKNVVSNWGIEKSKIVIIPNSFEANFSLLSHDAAREKLKLTGKILFSAGRLVLWKGFNTLIEIMPQLMDKIPGVSLYIAGDGPDEEELESMIERYRLNDRVKLLGRIPREEIFEWLSASDVFVLNTFYEGFSHQILEAMAIGTPVVTTTSGGNPEMIVHEKEGLLVSYNNKDGISNAIQRILSDTSFAHSLSSAGKQKAGSFTVNRMLEGVIQVLN